MWLKYFNGKFILNRMEIAKKDRFSQLLKKVELKNLSATTAPRAADACALVNEQAKQKAVKKHKRVKL